MADSTFWRELAEKFRGLLDTLGMLRADWYYQVGSGRGEWKLRGVGDASTIPFKILARRAASMLPSPDNSDLLGFWLDRLRVKSSKFEWGTAGFEQNADGTEGAHHLTGMILRLCQASADHCSELESNLLETEFWEEQQGAPQAEDVKTSEPAQASEETVGNQIGRLQKESRMTVEELAAGMNLNTRTVQRHLAGSCEPLPRNLTGYERVLSKTLKRNIVIKNMP